MFDEDPIRAIKPETLDRLSIADLEERIAALKAQIAACEAEIEKKRGHRSAADALFGGNE